MIKTTLSDDIDKLPTEKRVRPEVVELFYQRLYTMIDHIKRDIDCLRENSLVRLDDLKDLYMVIDVFGIQIEEVVDKIKSDPCSHATLRSVRGRKVCESCGIFVA